MAERASLICEPVPGFPSLWGCLCLSIGPPRLSRSRSISQAVKRLWRRLPDGREGRASSIRHPICKVLEWQERLNGDQGLTKVQIGEAEGLGKVRITQMFSLLRLPKDEQQHLASLISPALIKSFAIRRLMSVAKLPSARQSEVFEGMKAGAERRAG